MLNLLWSNGSIEQPDVFRMIVMDRGEGLPGSHISPQESGTLLPTAQRDFRRVDMRIQQLFDLSVRIGLADREQRFFACQSHFHRSAAQASPKRVDGPFGLYTGLAACFDQLISCRAARVKGVAVESLHHRIQ